MGRLIDADALLKEVENEQKYLIDRGQLSEEHILVHSLKRPVLDAPTVDAVEVVRCKDCVHCSDDWNGNQPMFTCELGMCGESVQPNDFCSYGERRSEWH